MKLSIIFPVLNQFPLATEAITMATQQLSGENDVEMIVLDNGSAEPYNLPETHESLVTGPLGGQFGIEHLQKNIGVYPTFWKGLKATDGEIIAYFHSDLIVGEKNWDMRVIKTFEEHPKLGLLGFIGSNEIDENGGRGSGTTSNFIGGKLEQYGVENAKTWYGSPASAHGMTNREYSNAAVVDGCAMIFRRSVLEQITQRENFPPHHFYDRLLSTEVLERGYEVGVLGIGCDHISGQTVNAEDSYQEMAKEWCETHGIAQIGDGWDAAVYQEAERQWLTEYRGKGMVPYRV